MGTNARGRATRERLLDAAEAVFAEHGWALSVEQVAEAAGVARPTVYRHFDDRDALLTAMLLRSSGQLAEELTAILTSELVWEERLVETVVATVRAVRSTPHLAALVRTGEVSSRWPEIDRSGEFLGAVQAFFRPWLELAVADGVELRGDVDDVLDWLLRTTLMQLTVPGGRGDGDARLRWEVETFVLPALLAP